LHYANSDAFAPTTSIDVASLEKAFLP